MAASGVLAATSDPEKLSKPILQLLSPCDITLLVALCKLERSRELVEYSFEMAYFEYVKHLKADGITAKQVGRHRLFQVEYAIAVAPDRFQSPRC